MYLDIKTIIKLTLLNPRFIEVAKPTFLRECK